jgi:hypothetical protein
MLYFNRSSRFILVSTFLIATLALTQASATDGERKLVARYASTGVAQGYVFTDGTAKIPDDAQLKAFVTALQGLTFLVYHDGSFDLQTGPGAFTFAFARGRVGAGVDGVLFLHFQGDPSTTPFSTMDGFFYPAGADPQANPARVTFSFTQSLPTGGTLTWHTIAALRPLPVQ